MTTSGLRILPHTRISGKGTEANFILEVGRWRGGGGGGGGGGFGRRGPKADLNGS